ncbi:MAG: hypothetical protein V4456_20805 [Bacteroidota bacterium]
MKFRWPLMILLIAVVLAATAGFLPHTTTRKALIKVSIFDLSAQLSDFQKWQKWDRLIVDKRYSLHINSPASFVLQKREDSPKSAQYITLKAVSADMLTQIEWTKNETGFEWLATKFNGKDEVADQLNSLKTFAENPSNLYGFPVRVSQVTEPLICLDRKTVGKGNIKDNIPQMVRQLSQYLSASNIPYKRDYYYVSYFAIDDKNTEIAVGVSVTEEFKAKDNFELLKFPVNGRLLIGDYQGPSNGINKLYAALDKYVTDKKMSKVALPMEKYPYNATPDTGTIKMQLIYPVY